MTHGTTAEYVAHRRLGEQACIACKAAWRTYYAALRAEKRKAK